MSIMFCEKHTLRWDSDFKENCPACDNEAYDNEAYAFNEPNYDIDPDTGKILKLEKSPLHPVAHWIMAILVTILATQGWSIAEMIYRLYMHSKNLPL